MSDVFASGDNTDIRFSHQDPWSNPHFSICQSETHHFFKSHLKTHHVVQVRPTTTGVVFCAFFYSALYIRDVFMVGVSAYLTMCENQFFIVYGLYCVVYVVLECKVLLANAVG